MSHEHQVCGCRVPDLYRYEVALLEVIVTIADLNTSEMSATPMKHHARPRRWTPSGRKVRCLAWVHHDTRTASVILSKSVCKRCGAQSPSNRHRFLRKRCGEPPRLNSSSQGAKGEQITFGADTNGRQALEMSWAAQHWRRR